ncbi:CocE/NonD family hydrolase [Tenacibaculum aiptasiae]|uniref:CocE/NonD family hydrolase n=1 Tax=Tenacibaculum aiptasiae TaxID=426481 RepID=UPI00232F38EE|nr:CocE/NonD family hydrolase [Tenacibaculum aiptasiae]
MKTFQRFKVLFFLLLVLLTSCNSKEDIQQQSRIVSKNGKQYIVNDSILITTRDGAKISAIIVRSNKKKEPYPTILFHTIYTRKNDINRAYEAADKGYVGIVSYTRGKNLSPDEITPYEHEGNDVYDVIDWITKQKWSNKEVGMYGGSYVGFVQWASMKEKVHPALKTIVPSVAAAPGIAEPMENGVYFNFHYPWWHYVTNNKTLDTVSYYNGKRWNDLYFDWYKKGVAYKNLDSLDGTPNPGFNQKLEHPMFDDYWKNMTLYKEDFSKINIPILSTTGYYDGGQFGTMHYLKSHYEFNKNAEHYLLIGPYSHFGAQELPEKNILGYTIDPVAQINIKEIIFDWFDYIFKGAEKPALLKDKINYQIMGANTWRHVSSLDNIASDSLKFYFSKKRSGVAFKSTYNTGNLGINEHFSLSNNPDSTTYLEQNIDFADRSQFSWNLSGDRNIVSKTLTVGQGFSFATEPFEKDIELSGSLSGVINASINKKDFDYNVLVYEQTAGGKFFNLTIPFTTRASMSNDIEKRTLLTPNEKTSIPINNFRMTSKKIKKGSRIVVMLNGIKHPFNQINYGTGKDVSQESIKDAKEPLQIKWYTDSYISIPINSVH